MTYVDEHGNSVYGQRIRNLGESELHSSCFYTDGYLTKILSQLRVPRSLLPPPCSLQTYSGLFPHQFTGGYAHHLRRGST